MGRKDETIGRHDLSGVAPDRRETIRRRIAAIEQYDSLGTGSVEEAARLAGDLGISTPSFYRLWRSWRSLRDPAALGGAQARRRRRADRDDVAFVRAVLAGSTHPGSHESKTSEVEREAARQGVRVRSRSALRRLVRDIREEEWRSPLAALRKSVVALDMFAIELPVTVEGLSTLPIAAAVIHPATGAVLSALLSVEKPSPALAAAALLRWTRLADVDPTGALIDAVMLPVTPDPDWAALPCAFGRVGVGLLDFPAGRLRPGSIAAASIGRHLLGFEIRQEMAKRAPADRRPKLRSFRLGAPPSLEEAQAAIDERIIASVRPATRIPDAASLAGMLEAIVRGARRPSSDVAEDAI